MKKKLKNLLRRLKWKRARKAVLKRFNRLVLSNPPRTPKRIESESYPQWMERVRVYIPLVNRYYRLALIELKEERKKR